MQQSWFHKWHDSPDSSRAGSFPTFPDCGEIATTKDSSVFSLSMSPGSLVPCSTQSLSVCVVAMQSLQLRSDLAIPVKHAVKCGIDLRPLPVACQCCLPVEGCFIPYPCQTCKVLAHEAHNPLQVHHQLWDARGVQACHHCIGHVALYLHENVSNLSASTRLEVRFHSLVSFCCGTEFWK